MPQATNLVVKNATNSDKTFTLISPAAGDDSQAIFQLKEGAISAIFPTLTISTVRRPNSRALKLKFFIPSSFTDTVTGLTTVKNRAEANLSLVIPNDFPEATKPDMVAFLVNLLNTTSVKAALTDAVPLT